MRRRYRYDSGLDAVVEIGGNYFEERPRGPSVIGDGLPGGVAGIRSHADGKQYDSKSRYTAEVKARGFEIVGNETRFPSAPAPSATDYVREVIKAKEQIAGNYAGTADWLKKQNERRRDG